MPRPTPGILSPVFKVNTVLEENYVSMIRSVKKSRHFLAYLVPFPDCVVDIVRARQELKVESPMFFVKNWDWKESRVRAVAV